MMKKFLSSLLALTMILSLVIVPANATGGADGTTAPTGSATLSITGATGKDGHAKVGDTLTFALTDPVVNDGSGTPSGESIQSITWQVNGNSNNGSYEVTTADAGKTLTVSYMAEIQYLLADQYKTGSVTINDTTKVHVDAEETYTYTVNGEVSVSAKPDTGIKSGDTVKFTVNTDKLFCKKISSNNTEHGYDLTEGTDYTLSYAWTVNGKSDPNKTASIDVKLTTDKASEKQTVSCKVSATFKDDPTYKSNSLSGSKTVTVTNDKVNADAEFEAAVKKVAFSGRTYGISGPVYYLESETNKLDQMAAVAPDGFTGVKTKCVVNMKTQTATLTVTGTKTEGNIAVTAEFELSCKKVTPTVTINKPSGLTGSTVYVGSAYTFTPSFAASLYGSTSGVKYEWTVKGTDVKTSNSGNNYTVTPGKAGKITITLTATDRGNEEYKATLELTVEANPYTAVATGKTEFTINTNETLNLATSSAPALYKDYGTSNQEKIAKNVTGPKWESNDKTVATVTSNGVVKGLKSGTATITATLTYEGKNYPVEYKVRVSALDCKLESVENGATVGYTRNDLMSAAEEAIYAFDRTRVDVTDVTVVLPSGTSYGTFYDDEDCGRNDKVTGSYSMDSGDELYFKSENGYVGSDVKVTLNVKTRSDGDYSVTAVIPVTMRKGEFESQVTGSDKTYKVTVPSGYEAYWVLSTSKEPAASEYDGSWATKTAGKYTSKSLYSFSTSNLKDGEGKLYIVAIDDKGIAYSGVIELKANAYTIKYSVVAGESVTFDQKRFESFMEDYADDNIKTSKGDYFEFDYVKFTSLPNSTREGTLYEGKDKIKTSTEVENLDKVTFESVAKAKDTIKVPFTLYAKQYDKNDKVIDKKVSMTGEVVISVVKEDIVFEVGVNSAIKLGSDKFIDFLRDSDKSYKKADLDYVTFDVGKNSAITSYFNGTGALYRYYNGNTGINATVSAKDEFYYNPKTSSKHYDLDDVAYVTSKFAKVGDIVYIPFTAYGTKSGQKAEGTLAIKVKQTMNFVDVHTYDYFYDSVQWAVNLGIAKGTSATTFSPKTGCTRAQIVTFLWRAANSPAPRSSTNKFTDVYATTHADYMKAIIWATEQGITTGTGNGKFSPDATCTRAQIVTFLYRFKNNPAVYGSLNFSDVNKTEHAAFYNAILWAVNNKITTGYGNGIFDPNGTCNRGDAVTFLYRALA